MSTGQGASTKEASQYHHFIPQFILRNFSHAYRPTGKQRRAKKNAKPALYPGEKVLYTLELTPDPPELKEAPVRRTFGLVDMYRDFAAASNQQDLELRLGKLETQVSGIISGICHAFNSGAKDMIMTRAERNELRKFFFLMKYRGRGFYRRFSGDAEGNYEADDKESFLQYMRDCGFAKPLDVWYHSVKAILNLKMDNEGQWRKVLPATIYPDDAYWFIMHSEMMYLAFCTPDDPMAEFIVTENSYSISEGPFSMAIDPVTKQSTVTAWTSYHEFGPLTPRLMMVLRSSLLPNPEEDQSDAIRESRERWYNMSASQHVGPLNATSILADLPISKARNSYTILDESGLRLKEGEDGLRRSSHTFCFRFFKISAAHTNLINALMLENADERKVIAFKDRDAFKATLEHYITLPSDQKFKFVSGENGSPKLKYLQRLEQILQQLGSNARLLYRQDLPLTEDQFLEIEGRELAKLMPDEPNEYLQLHLKLGGTVAGLPLDMNQVRKMIYLRIKIDVWSQGIDEAVRARARDNLTALYCEHVHPCKVRLYLKQSRVMALGRPFSAAETRDGELAMEFFDGPEDSVARACEVVHPRKLGWLMYHTVKQHEFSVRHPGVSLSAPISFDQGGLNRAMLEGAFAFAGPSGTMRSIRDCGIEPLEIRARMISHPSAMIGRDVTGKNYLWTVEEQTELFARVIVRQEFEKLLSGRLGLAQLAELKEALFAFTYPTYNAGLESRQ